MGYQATIPRVLACAFACAAVWVSGCGPTCEAFDVDRTFFGVTFVSPDAAHFASGSVATTGPCVAQCQEGHTNLCRTWRVDFTGGEGADCTVTASPTVGAQVVRDVKLVRSRSCVGSSLHPTLQGGEVEIKIVDESKG